MPYIQKKTLDLIVSTKNHYIICFKKNAGNIYKKINLNTENPEYLKSSYDKIEKNRDRIENRQIKIFEVSAEVKSEYPHCNSVIWIKRETLCKGKESVYIHYYLSDLKLSAEDFFKPIRNHWSIENNLHWVKDVVMKEDDADLKNKEIAWNISILRSFVITLANIFTGSVTKFQRQYAHNFDILNIF